jgi:hypothetical protein
MADVRKFMDALVIKNITRVNAMIEAGFNVNSTCPDGMPMILYAARSSGKIIRLLIQAGADPHFCIPRWNCTLLHDEDVRGGVVRELHKSGVDLNAVDSAGDTPMHVDHDSNVAFFRVMLELGVDVDIRNSEGYTPLLSAIDHGDVDVVRFLLAAGADANAVNGEGHGAAKLHRRFCKEWLEVHTITDDRDMAFFYNYYGSLFGDIHVAQHRALLRTQGITFDNFTTQLMYADNEGVFGPLPPEMLVEVFMRAGLRGAAVGAGVCRRLRVWANDWMVTNGILSRRYYHPIRFYMHTHRDAFGCDWLRVAARIRSRPALPMLH